MTGDQNTLVLLNGQRLSDFEGGTARLSSIPIESIERIEILRGSGAVQYGSGATAGTINIITKSPIGSPWAATCSARPAATTHAMRAAASRSVVNTGACGLTPSITNPTTIGTKTVPKPITSAANCDSATRKTMLPCHLPLTTRKPACLAPALKRS
ncbi:TonB-dependent receptor plug domain-containing protein [Neopusillimonas aromaticivorans]|uniref:TonB-dependent receptor plug domain-containing protein n=1 Tax=Neopusillimonas aromaticivorans TaxID=2979868 RepID=UPI0025988150|nr:TonB-dependent receptor plug domain-containing protein [Neopusillimonas aromaticivorans]WJJ93551.1 TonB-dependent receptor plug domain-containing protein [Neopusillimonas aromaticivorans]